MKITIRLILALFLFCFLQACSPLITRTIVKAYPPLNETEEVQVIALGDESAYQYEELGTVRVGDNGFGGKCKYDDQILHAKREAKKMGGNIIKVVEHIPPHSKMIGLGYAYFPCHEILVLVLRHKNSSKIDRTE